MLWTIAVILFILWILGFFVVHVGGALIHLLLVSEIITGLVTQGTTSIPTLLGEMSRLVVLAGLLWGSGDLALLLIDMGHDVRATRILLGRQALHQTGSTGITPPSGSPRVEGGSFVERGPR